LLYCSLLIFKKINQVDSFVHSNNYIKTLIALLAILFYHVAVLGQALESPIIKQYSNKEYLGSVSNHYIEQSSIGPLYFGNHSGLIEFDGNDWHLIEGDNGQAIFQIAISEGNKIFVGSENEFGYISVNLTGELSYQSLSKEYENLEFGRITSISATPSSVYYITAHHLFQYSNNKLNHWDLGQKSADFATFMHLNRLYFFIVGEGLFNINSKSEIEMVNDATKNDRILKVVDATDNNKLLLSAYGRQYIFQNDSIKTHHPYIKNIEDSLAIQISRDIKLLDNPSYQIIASRKNGVYFIKKGEIVHNSTQINGLSNNVIRNIHLTNNDLWASTYDGINKIEQFGIWSFWGRKNGLKGNISDLLKNGESLLIAASDGVFDLSKDGFNQTGNIKEHFKHYFKFNRNLYANSFGGIHEVSNNQTSLKLKLEFPSQTMALSDSTCLVISRNGIHLLRQLTETIVVEKTINSQIGGISKSALLDHNKNAWFGINNSGIAKITSDYNLTKYNTTNGLPDVVEPFIFKHRDKLLFATGSGFYKLNPTPNSDSSDIFIPDNSLISERMGISHPVTDSRGHIWYVATYGKSNTYIEKLTLQSDDSYIKVTRPFKRLPQQEYTKIYPDPEEEGMIWIAGTEGLYRYNDNIEVDYDIPFNTLVRKVHTRDSLIFAGTYFDPSDTAVVPSMLLDQSETFKPALIYADNQIRFDFTATSYEVPEKNQYSYRLKGNEKEWSAWSLETKKEYTNLRPGIYTFLVKSKNIYDTEGRTASYEFAILPPWWMTYWAYALYIILAVFIFWVTTLIYTYRIRVQRRKLKLIVADRTYEVLMQSKEIEKKNSLLIEQTEEITQQRDDISEKNQELESSQEEIMAINSRLKELNDHLEMQVDMRTKKIKSTLVQLRKTNKELDTFIYRASHDLKSPISRIMGLSTLAKLEMPDDMNREYFNLIELAANDMKKLLSKLTQVHEMLNKKVVIKEIDVPTLLSSIRESLKHLDRDSNIKYTFNIKDQLSLESDADIIRVIIENLVENAIIFRKEDSKERHHIITQLFEKDDMIHIIVRDNGQGIASELHNKLYDMFFRGSDNSKGTGLGLYLVKMAVENLEGTITLDSKPNEFTEFTVQLPIMNR